jgi:DNA-binding GntR family transcriptional regulator
VQKIENSNLTEAVYAQLKAMILDGMLVPGSRINKKELAAALEVSPTPINEAVSRLAGEKLIDQRTRQGFFVRSFDDRALADLYVIRAGLEGIAVRLCVAEASAEDLDRLGSFFSEFKIPVPPTLTHAYMKEDMAFHKAVQELSGIPLLMEINANFGYTMRSYQFGLVRSPSDTLPEHHAILEAIRARDAVKAGELMTRHHLASRKVLIAKLREQKE